MKKRYLIAITLIIIVLTCHCFAQVKSESRNKIDKINITKITPRTFSYLLRPVNIPIHVEIEYNLTSESLGRIVINCYRVSSRGKMEEVKGINKVFKVSQTKRTVTLEHVTPPLVIPLNDDTIFVYTVASLVGARGKELAYSSSKNFVSGTYRIIRESQPPVRDYVRRIDVSPRIGTDIKVGVSVVFNLTLQYSLKSKPVGYIDILFTDLAYLGTGKCWQVATVAIPRGQGKIKLSPKVEFPDNLSGRNMGIEIYYWLNPLKTSQDILSVTEYFLVK